MNWWNYVILIVVVVGFFRHTVVFSSVRHVLAVSLIMFSPETEFIPGSKTHRATFQHHSLLTASVCSYPRYFVSEMSYNVLCGTSNSTIQYLSYPWSCHFLWYLDVCCQSSSFLVFLAFALLLTGRLTHMAMHRYFVSWVILLGLALCLPSTSVSSVFMVLYKY